MAARQPRDLLRSSRGLQCSGRCILAEVDPVGPSPPNPPEEKVLPGEKVKGFPPAPGVYLMKDAQGRVIYVGKAKNLRNRASHYFTKIAAAEERTADLVKLICDIDFVACDS